MMKIFSFIPLYSNKLTTVKEVLLRRMTFKFAFTRRNKIEFPLLVRWYQRVLPFFLFLFDIRDYSNV